MAREKIPATPAIRLLTSRRIAFTLHSYRYVDRGGTRQAAVELGVDEHSVVKTLVFAAGSRHPLLVLMHGDCQVSTKALARHLSVKAVEPVAPEEARRITGYTVGGISPFGTRTALPVYMQSSIVGIRTIYINGGKRGLLLALSPVVLTEILGAEPVDIAVAPGAD